jgi:predicted metal-dependent enzyme (double-stranded beta helix superfamily)
MSLKSLGLVEPIRRAMRDDRVTGLARALAKLEESGDFEDPALFSGALPDRYARRLIWRDPEGGFVIVGMTWAPGQSAPLHDHGGVWGVEIVARGTMRETAYRLVERDPQGRVRFVREGERVSTKGTAGALCPPHDYHTFGNAGTTPAYTVHVYGGPYARCNLYTTSDERWWTSTSVPLGYDA